MKFGIIIGSHRAQSQSTKVGKYVERQVQKLFSDAETYVLDLRENPLPLWREEMWEDESEMKTLWQPYSKELATCDAFVVVAPEWNGMVPAGLKNFFLFAGKEELGHKPGLIVSVSASRGGAYPIAELRTSSYKNCRLCYIPEHVILSKVEGILNSDELDENDKADAYAKKRIAFALKILHQYAGALKSVRQSDLDLYEFTNGM